MTITRDNCKIINTRDVYLHDDIIEQINYDCDTKQLTFLVTKAVMNFTYKICFFDVAGFEASACDYWGVGDLGFWISTLKWKTVRSCQNCFQKRKTSQLNMSGVEDSEMESFLKLNLCFFQVIRYALWQNLFGSKTF